MYKTNYSVLLLNPYFGIVNFWVTPTLSAVSYDVHATYIYIKREEKNVPLESRGGGGGLGNMSPQL